MQATKTIEKMAILDGKKVSEEIKISIKAEVDNFIKKGHRAPRLIAVIVGNNTESRVYVNNKLKQCKDVGFSSENLELPAIVTQEELLYEIDRLNKDKNVDGFIIQLPLPAHIDEKVINENILPEKDVDGFNPINIGRLLIGDPRAIIPATPRGVMELMKCYGIEIKGKNIVMIGRSNIVGRPLSVLMNEDNEMGNGTVTVVHRHTKNVGELTRNADIVVTAIGKVNFLKADMVKKGAVIVDVGINSVPDDTKKTGFRLCGDVDYDNVKEISSYITPVPGGVGPMTIVMLMKNTLEVYKKYYLQEK